MFVRNFVQIFNPLISSVYCGKTGIRTLGTRKGTTVFETVPIDRSGIFPCSLASLRLGV